MVAAEITRTLPGPACLQARERTGAGPRNLEVDAAVEELGTTRRFAERDRVRRSVTNVGEPRLAIGIERANELEQVRRQIRRAGIPGSAGDVRRVQVLLLTARRNAREILASRCPECPQRRRRRAGTNRPGVGNVIGQTDCE